MPAASRRARAVAGRGRVSFFWTAKSLIEGMMGSSVAEGAMIDDFQEAPRELL